MKESQKVEFKTSVGEWKEIVKTVCAFANTEGGEIYIGINDNGNIQGIQLGKNTINDLIQKIITNTEPKIYPKYRVEQLDNKDILVLQIYKYYENITLAFGIPYKRVNSATIRISKDEYERRIIEIHKEIIRFDNQINERAKLNNLDDKIINFLLQKAIEERSIDIPVNLNKQEILMHFNLMKEQKLLNAAILLCGKNPQTFFNYAIIKCVKYKGNDVTAPTIDIKEIQGNLINQVNEAEKFIFEHIKLISWIEDGKIERQERWEYPPKAIRESLVNAIVHRDYRAPFKVYIKIFEDKIEISNPGKLPDGWTTENLKVPHDSRPYNPLIARIFFLLKYIEELGSGTNKIIEWCKEWDLPEPDFKFDGSSITVIIRKTIFSEEYLNTLELNEKERIIINYLKTHNIITSKEIQNMFNISREMANRYLNRLIQMSLLEKKGQGRNIYYRIK